MTSSPTDKPPADKTVIWVPLGADQAGWITRATALPVVKRLPNQGQPQPDVIFALWPSAQNFVARAVAGGAMPSTALEDWSEMAMTLMPRLEGQVTLIDHDTAVGDPLLVLETLGFDESLALHAVDGDPAPTGLPGLIAGEALIADPQAAQLDSILSERTAGRDAALDVDDLAQTYGEALLQGNTTAVQQMRDTLLDRRTRRMPLASDPFAASAAVSPASEIPDTLTQDLARLTSAQNHLRRALADRDRKLSRTAARIVRLEGMLNALLAELATDGLEIEPQPDPQPVAMPEAIPTPHPSHAIEPGGPMPSMPVAQVPPVPSEAGAVPPFQPMMHPVGGHVPMLPPSGTPVPPPTPPMGLPPQMAPNPPQTTPPPPMNQIHPAATADNPLALSPDRPLGELGPDRENRGGGKPPVGGLLGRFRKK